jgi:hypothetical protein
MVLRTTTGNANFAGGELYRVGVTGNQRNRRGELTPFGRETLAELHDGFIADLNANGWPEMPAAH